MPRIEGKMQETYEPVNFRRRVFLRTGLMATPFLFLGGLTGCGDPKDIEYRNNTTSGDWTAESGPGSELLNKRDEQVFDNVLRRMERCGLHGLAPVDTINMVEGYTKVPSSVILTITTLESAGDCNAVPFKVDNEGNLVPATSARSLMQMTVGARRDVVDTILNDNTLTEFCFPQDIQNTLLAIDEQVAKNFFENGYGSDVIGLGSEAYRTTKLRKRKDYLKKLVLEKSINISSAPLHLMLGAEYYRTVTEPYYFLGQSAWWWGALAYYTGPDRANQIFTATGSSADKPTEAVLRTEGLDLRPDEVDYLNKFSRFFPRAILFLNNKRRRG